MKIKNLIGAALLTLSGVGASFSAYAINIGYYLSSASGSPADAITASGNTATALAGLGAGNLAGIDVLWILNGNNGAPDAQVTGNTAAINAFVSAGGVLAFHDRSVTNANTYIPGAAGVNFVRDFANGSNIDVIANNTVTNGPAGIVNNATLDNGSYSNHGYAAAATLPSGAVAVLNNGVADQIVDFYFRLGAGDVYYSTIPLDYYLEGNSPFAFRDIYAKNVAGFLGQLRAGNGGREEAAVPLPATALLLMLGLGVMGFARRRVA
jgi:hypothetical protein